MSVRSSWKILSGHSWICERVSSPAEQIDDATGIMAAVMGVTWPISTEYGEESRYNTLLQISIGQEEVDEVITRDIHRTFPEHPQFGFPQGQQALFRVLKAYSLHDLEVGSLHRRFFTTKSMAVACQWLTSIVMKALNLKMLLYDLLLPAGRS